MPIDEIIGKRDLRLTFFHVFLLQKHAALLFVLFAWHSIFLFESY